jgi:hypothetical protein
MDVVAVVIALVGLVFLASVLVVVARRRSGAAPRDESLRAGQAHAESAQQVHDRAQGASSWTRIGGGGGI